MFDQVGDDQPEATGAERPGDSEKDQQVVLKHLAPHRVGVGQISALERDARHALENLFGGQTGLDLERLDRHSQESGLLGGHALCHSASRSFLRSVSRVSASSGVNRSTSVERSVSATRACPPGGARNNPSCTS